MYAHLIATTHYAYCYFATISYQDLSNHVHKYLLSHVSVIPQTLFVFIADGRSSDFVQRKAVFPPLWRQEQNVSCKGTVTVLLTSKWTYSIG